MLIINVDSTNFTCTTASAPRQDNEAIHNAFRNGWL